MYFVADLANLVLSYVPFKILQRWTYQKLRIQLNLKQILQNRYQLTEEQELNVWEPTRQQLLTEWENFCAFYTNMGEPGYEGHLYSSLNLFVPLLNAIRAKDIELIQYYIFRYINKPSKRSYMNRPSDYDEILELYALRTDDINIIILVNLICELSGSSGFNLSVAKHEAFEHIEIIKQLSKYIIKDEKSTIVNAVIEGKTFKSFTDLEISNGCRYISLEELQERILTRALPDELSKLVKDNYNLVMPDVFPFEIVRSTSCDSPLITSNTINRARKMKQIVLEHYRDSYFRREYILLLDILLGLDVTINASELDRDDQPVFIFLLIISVMHRQAFQQISHILRKRESPLESYCSEIIYNPEIIYIYNYDPKCLPLLNKDNLVSLALTNKLMLAFNFKLIDIPIIRLRKTLNYKHFTENICKRGLVKHNIIVDIDELNHLPSIPCYLPVVPASPTCYKLIKNNYDLEQINIVINVKWFKFLYNTISKLSNKFIDYDLHEYLFGQLLKQFS